MNWQYKIGGRKHIQSITVLLATALLLCGCHKKNPTANEPTAAPNAPATLGAASAPAAINAGPTVVPKHPLPPDSPQLKDPTIQTNLRWLNAQVSEYLRRYHQMPRSFNNLVNDLQLQVPEPPAGMRYTIYMALVTLETTQ